MKHHWGDLLDREHGYWQMVPNRERYAYVLKEREEGDKAVEVMTVHGSDEEWQKICTFPNLIELTLHQPTVDQLEAISELTTLKRLRITHARPKTIDFIRPLKNLEELILEYVSGFSDLSPLSDLDKLRALHFENLRRISSFEGISGLKNLLYLSIDGTFDWKQPIEDFEFLRGLESLEYFSLASIITKKAYPAMLPILGLKNLKYLKILPNKLAIEEYALMEVGLEGVEGAVFPPVKKFSYIRSGNSVSCLRDSEIKGRHPEIVIRDGKEIEADRESESFDFLGKGQRGIKCSSKTAEAKCQQHIEKYEALKEEARLMLGK